MVKLELFLWNCYGNYNLVFLDILILDVDEKV